MKRKQPENKKPDSTENKKPEHAEKQKPAKNELEELRETLQRVQAEFENSRKRLDREKQEFVKAANAGLVKELLPLFDSVDAARDQLDDQRQVSKEDAIEGIELIKKQLLAILKSHGLEEIKCLGKKFDPMLHDCVMKGKNEKKEEDLVLKELQKGYMLNGKVLRHAKVKVNKP